MLESFIRLTYQIEIAGVFFLGGGHFFKAGVLCVILPVPELAP